MILADVTLGARQWLLSAVLLTLVALLMLAWSYRRAGSSVWPSLLAMALKGIGIMALAVCLIEPLFTGTRPRPGSNLFLVVADNSRSMQVSDGDGNASRAQRMKERLSDQTSWLTRLAQDFDVRRYAFDTSLRPMKSFDELTFDGEASAMNTSLSALVDRLRGQPVAGILLFTDGNATDLAVAANNAKSLPPVYPVTIGSETDLIDLSISHVAVSQTNFEAAPVTITATLEGHGAAGKQVGLRLLNESGEEIERRKVEKLIDGEPSVQRLLLRPEKAGISFYTVQAFLAGEEQFSEGDRRSQEATLANNRRFVTVDRGGGPYRVLYVGGRPNWEFKFLRRAIDEDDEVKLVSMLRIAKKEPKFKFLSRTGERTNPLFRGFGNQDEQAEQYDEPVLLRLGTENPDELRSGFPKNAEDIFRYHAIILDDIEAAFFTQDQLSLLQQFVARRGGGLLMLGGKESFFEGGYQRASVAEMLPVYLDRAVITPADSRYRLNLTREGWLQPWVRLRTNEQDEQKRLAGMPDFKSLNLVHAIKPGASVLADTTSADGTQLLALVVQQFGRGRTAALLLGDLWRWNLKRSDHTESDLEKLWRQSVRWLVSDVPGRVEVETRHVSGNALFSLQLLVRARDSQFQALDNAKVEVRVRTPEGSDLDLVAENSDQVLGEYEATFAPRVPGVYRATVNVTAPDGSEVGQREIGWSVEPQTEEFRKVDVNRSSLESLAKASRGEVIALEQLDRFISSLPNRKIPITETWMYPLWHQSSVFLLAIGCLIGEWGLRRWRGMP